MAGLHFALENEVSGDSPIVVRDCLFDYAILSIAGGVGHSTFAVERNYFRNSNVGLGNLLDRAIVRHNVFDGAKACFWIQGLTDIGRVLEICNNTAATGVAVVNGAPLRGVILRNNITGHDVEVDEQVYKLCGEMAKNWQRDHNSYLRRPLFAKLPTDVTADPAYLSTEPADRDYLRFPADGPLATGGAGGELPTYMGALPPGPAPKEGDWFTRLRERWQQASASSPPSAPKETLDILSLLDLAKDRVSVENLTGGNNWSRSGDKLTYTTNGRSGKIVAPVDLKGAKDYEFVVDVRRLSGNSVFTLDFPASEKLGTGIDLFIGGVIELKLEKGVRHTIGAWPSGIPDGGQVVARIRHENSARQGSVEVLVNGNRAAHWQGVVARIGNPLESHPAFPGRMTVGLFCFQDSFEFRSWQLRVFEGQAEVLRPIAGKKD